jgi:hypothetical protein
MPEFTVKDLIEEARREVALRRKVFPRWVEERRITASEADRRVALMEAIEKRLTRSAALDL